MPPLNLSVGIELIDEWFVVNVYRQGEMLASLSIDNDTIQAADDSEHVMADWEWQYNEKE